MVYFKCENFVLDLVIARQKWTYGPFYIPSPIKNGYQMGGCHESVRSMEKPYVE